MHALCDWCGSAAVDWRRSGCFHGGDVSPYTQRLYSKNYRIWTHNPRFCSLSFAAGRSRWSPSIRSSRRTLGETDTCEAYYYITTIQLLRNSFWFFPSLFSIELTSTKCHVEKIALRLMITVCIYICKYAPAHHVCIYVPAGLSVDRILHAFEAEVVSIDDVADDMVLTLPCLTPSSGLEWRYSRPP